MKPDHLLREKGSNIQTKITKIPPPEKCRALNRSWSDVTTETKFPVKKGKVVDLQCRNEDLSLTGDTSVTCIAGYYSGFILGISR
jgi:hypothetical protein